MHGGCKDTRLCAVWSHVCVRQMCGNLDGAHQALSCMLHCCNLCHPGLYLKSRLKSNLRARGRDGGDKLLVVGWAWRMAHLNSPPMTAFNNNADSTLTNVDVMYTSMGVTLAKIVVCVAVTLVQGLSVKEI